MRTLVAENIAVHMYVERDRTKGIVHYVLLTQLGLGGIVTEKRFPIHIHLFLFKEVFLCGVQPSLKLSGHKVESAYTYNVHVFFNER